MKVGLVRHFEVEYKLPSLFTWITPEQFEQWLNEYEMADIKNCEAEPDIIWGKCYSSDSPRAVKTAQKLFNGPINETRILRELVVSPPIRKSIKLPLCLWFVIGRIAWMLSHKSQVESKLMFEKRLKQIVQEIILNQNTNILIVSHGALLMYLRKELIKNGFKGPNFKIATNGKIYVFEK